MQLYVGFSTPYDQTELLGWIIRTVEKAPYSHTYLCWYSNYFDKKIVYQASGLEVNFVSLDRFQEQNKVVAEFVLEVPDSKEKEISRYCLEVLGTPYGIRHLIGLGLVKLWKLLFNKTIRNPFRDRKNSEICVECVAKVLIDILKVDIGEDIEEMGLHDLYRVLEKVALKCLPE